MAASLAVSLLALSTATPSNAEPGLLQAGTTLAAGQGGGQASPNQPSLSPSDSRPSGVSDTSRTPNLQNAPSSFGASTPGALPQADPGLIDDFQSPTEAPSSRFAAPPSPYTPATPEEGFALPAPAVEGNEHPLQWGPFRFVPAIRYRFSYRDGLPNRSFGAGEERVDVSVQHTVAPSLTIESEHLSLAYSPSLNYYAKGPYGDTVNHAVSFRAGFGYGDWRFGASHNYGTGSRVLVETGRQTETERHSTGLSASYLFNEKLSADLTVSQSITESGGDDLGLRLNSAISWSTMNWLNYQLTDITQLGIGVGGGYSDVELGADMSYEQVQGRIRWAPRRTIDVDLNGGFEVRQFLGADAADDQVNPLVGLAATYRPFENTALFLTADRGVSASVFADQITETTSFSASLSQRLLGHIKGTLKGGIRMVDYQQSSIRVSPTFNERSDDISFVTVALGASVFKKGNISVSYSHTSNDSNVEQFKYDSDIIAVQVGYTF